MIRALEHLSKTEIEQLIDAIPLITILIGGADGVLDKDEKEWAKKITEIRTYNNQENLNEFYKMVGEVYSKKLDAFSESLPNHIEDRTKHISEKLTDLNEIMSKLDNDFGSQLYESYVSFAGHVAKASGGFLRFFNVSSEEKKLIDLPMLTPIVPIVSDSEEIEEV